MTKIISVGGVKISVIDSIEHVINEYILDSKDVKSGVAIAINPEKIITAQSDASLMKFLEQSSLNYPDGFGVSYVMSKKADKHVACIPGCELWEQLMLASVKQQVPIYLLGGSEEVLNQTYEKLRSKNVNIVGYHHGYFSEKSKGIIIKKIKSSKAKIISVALGSPKQEVFMFECLNEMPSNFFMGVGGSYDVFTGNVSRAPKILRKVHLEWLYRVVTQPTRIKRQLSLLKYIWLYITGKL